MLATRAEDTVPPPQSIETPHPSTPFHYPMKAVRHPPTTELFVRIELPLHRVLHHVHRTDATLGFGRAPEELPSRTSAASARLEQPRWQGGREGGRGEQIFLRYNPHTHQMMVSPQNMHQNIGEKQYCHRKCRACCACEH